VELRGHLGQIIEDLTPPPSKYGILFELFQPRSVGHET
jgi:hypothetical protein